MSLRLFVCYDFNEVEVKRVEVDTDEPQLIEHQLLHINGVERVEVSDVVE